jgi:aspartate-semialdehyde dehydrogenase
MMVYDARQAIAEIAKKVAVVFSAIDLPAAETAALEMAYAAHEVAVVSNNSAHRWSDEVAMIIPEINPDHLGLVDRQRKSQGWKRGLVVVKPNCSIQSYVPVLHALRQFNPSQVIVTSIQAISGAGKTFSTWPEMVDNVIPFIKGEEQKSEREPLKIWGSLGSEGLKLAETPQISATCIRIPVSDGHTASVAVQFEKQPTQAQIVAAITHFKNPIAELNLPSAPRQFLHYFEKEDRPQTKQDRDLDHGMAISVGRLRQAQRQDQKGWWHFVALSHNTIRGAAGGAVLTAELLKARGYV